MTKGVNKMIRTPWGQISDDYSKFSFVPKWGGECEPISADGHFLTDDLRVHMVKDSWNKLSIMSVTDDNQNFHHVDLEPGILKMLDLQGRVRYNESLKHVLKL